MGSRRCGADNVIQKGYGLNCKKEELRAPLFTHLKALDTEGIRQVCTQYKNRYNDIRPNLNYYTENTQVAIDIAIDVAIDIAIDDMAVTALTKAKIRSIFDHTGYDIPFGRKDIAEIVGVSQTAAGNVINKLKAADMIESVRGLGKGKYKFKKKNKRSEEKSQDKNAGENL